MELRRSRHTILLEKIVDPLHLSQLRRCNSEWHTADLVDERAWYASVSAHEVRICYLLHPFSNFIGISLLMKDALTWATR